jgi:predicted nucleic acid-binding Zn ribbon protein
MARRKSVRTIAIAAGRSVRRRADDRIRLREEDQVPTYDYRCEANGQVYEVRHAMALRPKTWGELRAAGALAEDAAIPDDAPVTRLMTAAGVVNSRVLKNPEAPACARSGCAGNCR